MPQGFLPKISPGTTSINDSISVTQSEDKWIYFCGLEPIYDHQPDDQTAFAVITSMLCAQGACKQVEIARAFGVHKRKVLRDVNKYRKGGIQAFYKPRTTRQGPVMTPDVISQAEQRLRDGASRSQVAQELDIKYDTLRKAIADGRVKVPQVPQESSDGPATNSIEPSNNEPQATDKSTRSQHDHAAADMMGMACTRPIERVLAAVGELPGGASTEFVTSRDVSFGGVLCAMPALIANGLFKHLDDVFDQLDGYYLTIHVIVLLANMALCRIKTVEQRQYESPGELGKLQGLDRVPEVRCLRNKLKVLSDQDGGQAPEKLAALLAQQWLEHDPDLSGTLYVDGHVRLYHGKQTQLPRRYVSRQRLCLRGTTDYWVNDALGQPFFSVERPIDQGMLEAIEYDIVPRLLNDVPNQPTQEMLDADPDLARFILVFDREGYSPKTFRKLWEEHRIACISYHKFPKGEWDESEFREVKGQAPDGQVVSMMLAERRTYIGSKKDSVQVKEIRKLSTNGYQTSLISTAYGVEGQTLALRLFSRWCQENFFRYMMQHFAIDLLSEYSTEEISGTNRPVVNPAWRELDREYRSVKGKLDHRHARFGAMTIGSDASEEQVKAWESSKAELIEQIEQLQEQVDSLKDRRKQTPKHINWDDMPDDGKFERLAPSRKRLTDTVKLVAYRSETAMANILRDQLSNPDQARSVLRDLLRSDADIIPDPDTKTLTIRLHSMSTQRFNRAVEHLIESLNDAECTYPGTDYRLVYQLGNPENGPT